MSGVYAVKVVGTVSGINEKCRGIEGQAGGRGRKLIAQASKMDTGDADILCFLQLPDDVKQNIEDAGARYIPYVQRLFDNTVQAC